jgi:excisionase family DNA binding protein
MTNERLRHDSTLVNRKIIVESASGATQVYADAEARPFSRLRNDDLLDTADICSVMGCSARTVYRWIAEEGLEPQWKVGRIYLFEKGEFLEWWEENEPIPGRPPKHTR